MPSVAGTRGARSVCAFVVLVALSLVSCEEKGPADDASVAAPAPITTFTPASPGVIPVHLVAGPFAVPDAKKRLVAAPLGVEGRLAPSQGEAATAARPRPWVESFADEEGVLPLEDRVESGKAVHYLVTYVESASEREAVLILDATAGVRAWVNGRTVLLQESKTDGEPVHSEGLFTLPKGQSVLVAAVGSSSATLKGRIVDPKGKPMEGLLFSLAPSGALAPRTEEDPAYGRRWLAEGHPSKWRDPILSLVGEVVQLSRPLNPAEALPYTEALMTVKYRVLGTTLGEFEGEHIAVAHWCVRDLKRTPEAKFRVGDRHRLDLDLYDDHKEFEFVTLSDDLGFDENLTLYMVLSWRPAGSGSAQQATGGE